MKYIAHKDGEREQTIKEHLIGTATLAGQFAEKFGSKDWGYCGGMLHDIGKYSEEFQKKINEDTNNMVAVSYTHLDVYKRQSVCRDSWRNLCIQCERKYQ